MSPIPLGIFAVAGSGAAAGAYELISTTVSGSVSSVTFSSIPSTYKHLQLRGVSKVANGNISLNLRIQMNASSTGHNDHQLFGDGASVGSLYNPGASYIQLSYATQGTGTTGAFGATILDILDYASTVKNKTTRSLSGFVDGTGTQSLALGSGLFASTSAITSLTITNQVAANFNAVSRFSLYGIKG
jgi:hypothetical protein